MFFLNTAEICFKKFEKLWRYLSVFFKDLLCHLIIHIEIISVIGISVEELVAVLPFTSGAETLSVALTFAFFFA